MIRDVLILAFDSNTWALPIWWIQVLVWYRWNFIEFQLFKCISLCIFEELYIVWYVTDVLKANRYSSICLVPPNKCVQLQKPDTAGRWQSPISNQQILVLINAFSAESEAFFQMLVLVSQLCNCNTLNEHCGIPLVVMTNISIPVWILIGRGAVRHSSALLALLYRRAFSHIEPVFSSTRWLWCI